MRATACRDGGGEHVLAGTEESGELVAAIDLDSGRHVERHGRHGHEFVADEGPASDWAPAGVLAAAATIGGGTRGSPGQ